MPAHALRNMGKIYRYINGGLGTPTKENAIQTLFQACDLVSAHDESRLAGSGMHS